MMICLLEVIMVPFWWNVTLTLTPVVPSITSASSRRVYPIIPVCLITAVKIHHSGSRVFSYPPPAIQHVITSHLEDHVASLTHLTETITGSAWAGPPGSDFCTFLWPWLRITWSKLIVNIRLTTRHGRLVRSLLFFLSLTAEAERSLEPRGSYC